MSNEKDICQSALKSHGNLSVLVLEMRNLPNWMYNKRIYIRTIMQLRARSTNSILCQGTSVILNQKYNFVIDVHARYTNANNWICVEVMEDGESKELGKVNFHLHHIIKHQISTGWYRAYNESKEFVAEICLAFNFCYGYFGFGYSSQLLLTANDGTPIKMKDHLLCTMYPKAPIPEARRDGGPFNTMIAKVVPHPHYIPWINKIDFSNFILSEEDPPPKEKKVLDEVDLHRLLKLRRELISFSDTDSRLCFINDLLSSSKERIQAGSSIIPKIVEKTGSNKGKQLKDLWFREHFDVPFDLLRDYSKTDDVEEESSDENNDDLKSDDTTKESSDMDGIMLSDGTMFRNSFMMPPTQKEEKEKDGIKDHCKKEEKEKDGMKNQCEVQ